MMGRAGGANLVGMTFSIVMPMHALAFYLKKDNICIT